MAQKKTKKKNGKSNKVTSKNQKKTVKLPPISQELKNFIAVIVLFVLSVISLLRMGFVGGFVDSLMKYLFGSFSYVIYLLLFIFPIMFVFKKQVKYKLVISSCLTLLAILFELIYFKMDNYKNFSLQYVFKNFNEYLGGGIIAKYLTKGLVFLLSYYGALIIIISLLIFIILIHISRNYPEQFEKITNIFKKKKLEKKEKVKSRIKDEVVLSKEILDEENTTEEYYNNIKDDELVVDMNTFEQRDDKLNRRSIKNNTPKLEVSEDVEEYVNEETSYENYVLPPLSLLQDPVENKKISKDNIVNKSKVLQSTFKNFGIEVKIVKAIVGPSITQFQILPTPGTKVSKIVNLSSDIALNLAAKDIRIEAPIPGKSLIGIEIPNSVNQLVTMKEVFVNDNDDSPLSVALGKDVSGESIFARLDKMPHLLVAGSTGSGKSVCINTIITSLLLKNKPNKVKLIMIDPKMVELSIYDGIPHLLTPVVTNPLKAADVLHKVVLEMERRYKEFSIARVKNIDGYNKIAKVDPDYKELPYIIVVIDELADLMMVASKEVEESIARISQMARAAGIHLIIATQRPSVDVITGVIKTNIPSRIAFAVSSSFDSRTIIDKVGAEALLGKGDMLFQSAESSKPVRVQGAFLSDKEVENVIDFIKAQSDSEYDPNMLPSENASRESAGGGDVDPLYKEVLIFIAKTQKASASLLQRRFKIGYNRAARIIETLEEDGYISPQDGSKPRKVFLEPEYAENNE